MTIRLARSLLTPTNVLMVLGIANLMFLSGMFGYVQYTTQYKQQIDQSTNDTTTEIKNLINVIHRSDEADDKRTESLLNSTLAGQYRNYLALRNGTNQTNTLLNFLSENFGSQSGYLERENFQYARANETYEMIKDIYDRTR